MKKRDLRAINKARFEAWVGRRSGIDTTPRQVKQVHSPVRWHVLSVNGHPLQSQSWTHSGLD